MKILNVTRFVGWTLLGIAAAIGSFTSLMALATYAGGWPRGTEFLLPISIDVFVVLSIVEWRTAAIGSRARHIGIVKSWGAIVVSAVGNALSHLIAAGIIPTNWVLTAAVGAVPAVALGLAFHTAFAPLRAPESNAPEPTSENPTPELPASGSADSAPALGALADPDVTGPAPAPSAELKTVIENIRKHRAQHQKPPSRTVYRQLYGAVSNERFADAKKAALNGHSEHN